MDSLKIAASLITMGFYTGYVHFTQGGPLPSWDLKTHFIYNMLKKGNSPKQGKSLEEVRKIKDINIFPPSKDFGFTKTHIPDYYRELSHNIIKEKLVKEIGKYPIERENAFWYNSEKLELELAVPKIKDPNVERETLVYLHGGCYIYGSINTHRPLFCKLGEKANCQVAALNYRLAPEYPFPCALEDTLAAYLYLTSQETAEHPGMGIDASKIVVAGDSAGGGLSSSFLILLSQLEGYKMVAGGLLLSPWVDLTSSQPSILTKKNDFLEAPRLEDGERYLFVNELLVNVPDNLKEEIVDVNGHFYTTEKYLKYPLVSPMYQDNFDGFPPIMVIVGDEERFEDECMIFADKLKGNNKAVSNSQQVILHVYDEMVHLFQTFDSHPSCQKSFELGSKFITDCLSNNINNNNNDQFWACRIDTKLNLTPLNYDITEYQVPQAFSLKEEGGSF